MPDLNLSFKVGNMHIFYSECVTEFFDRRNSGMCVACGVNPHKGEPFCDKCTEFETGISLLSRRLGMKM